MNKNVNFLRKIALDNKDSDGNITLQFYFSKLEQILLQYNLSLEDEKNYAKYYVWQYKINIKWKINNIWISLYIFFYNCF